MSHCLQQRRAGLAGALLVMVLANAPAHAATGDWYAGASAGPTKALDLSSGAINQALAGQGLSVATTTVDSTSTGWKLYGGRRLGGNFAVEAGYADLGRYDFSGQVVTDPGTVDARLRANEWFLAGVASWPLAPLELHARFGMGYWHAKLNASGAFGGAGVANTSASGWGTIFGVGVQYALSPQWSARLEWERYMKVGKAAVTGRTDIEMWSLGLVYQF